MIIYENLSFTLYFGDQAQQIEPSKCKSLTSSSLFSQDPFGLLEKRLNVSVLTFLHQVHKADGKIVKSKKSIEDVPLFFEEGDYLATNQSTVGLGIVTADCLPIVFFDRLHKVVAIAHAGWRGSIAGIAIKVMKDLETYFFTQKKDVTVFFGPAAKNCCYQVDEPFLEKIGSGYSVEKALSQKNNHYYFDSALYNAQELISFGFSEQQLVFDYNVCTICNDNFCSYRRQGGLSTRQITVVSLK